jgi:hypothetical protein
MEEYYAIRELEPLVQALKDADDAVEKALEQREACIRALAEGWHSIEAKRETAYELSEAAE